MGPELSGTKNHPLLKDTLTIIWHVLEGCSSEKMVLGCSVVPQLPIILIKCSFLIPPALAGSHSSSCTNQCWFYICAFRLTRPWFKHHCQEHLVNRQHFMCCHKKKNKSPNAEISNFLDWVFLTLGDQTFSTFKWEQQHQKYS